MKTLFQKIRYARLALSLAALTFLASCEKTADLVQPQPKARAAAQEFRLMASIRGINVNQDYYPIDFGAIKAAGFNTVRIVVRPELDVYKQKGFSDILQMMRAARDQGLSIMMTYYVKSYMDNYDPNATYNASIWWVNRLTELQAVTSDFAINILNEPSVKTNGVVAITAETWRNQQTNAVQRLRSAGFAGPVIIDAPGYGHETSFVSAQGRNVAPTYTGVAFSLHLYPDSFYNGGLPTDPAQDVQFMNNLKGSLSSSQRIIIGEFGDTYRKDGQLLSSRTRVLQFVDNAQASSADCGAIGWTWNGDGLNMNAKDEPDYLSWLSNVGAQ